MARFLVILAILGLSSCSKAEVKTESADPSVLLESKLFDSVEAMAKAVNKEGFLLILDEVKLDDSAVTTPAGRYFRDLVTTGAIQSKLFKVLQTKKEFLSTTNNRTLEFLFDADFDGFLQMRYSLEGADIRLSFRLLHADTPELLYAGDVRIRTNWVPSSLSLLPGNYADYRKNGVGDKVLQTNDFHTAIWTDKGRSAVYVKGEKMVLLAKSEIDCYVKIYYTDVSGKVQLIFPNAWEKNNFLQGGRVYKIPSAAMDFEFEMGAPYGVESIRMIAQDAQFEDLGAGDYGDSFRFEGNIAAAGDAKAIYPRGITVKKAGGKAVRHSESITTTSVWER